MDDVHEPNKSPHNPNEKSIPNKANYRNSAKMSYLSSLRTPTKRIVMRPLKKPTKPEHEATIEELEAKLNTDNQGVGVIGEVTPDSRSTSGILSVMRANTTERHELGLSSEPNTHFGQGSSNQTEGAQEHRVSERMNCNGCNMFVATPVVCVYVRDMQRCWSRRSSCFGKIGCCVRKTL